MNSIFTDVALCAIIAILVYGQIMRKPQPKPAAKPAPVYPRDTIDGWLASPVLDAYVCTTLPAPVAEKLVRSTPAPEPQQRKYAPEHPISVWARIFRLQEEGRRIRAEAAREVRERGRHEAWMTGFRSRLAEPMPSHLERHWTENTGQFKALVDADEQLAASNGTVSFVGATS